MARTDEVSTDMDTESCRRPFSRQSSESMMKSPREKQKWSSGTGSFHTSVLDGQCPSSVLTLPCSLNCTDSDGNCSVEALHSKGLVWLCHELTKDISVSTGTEVQIAFCGCSIESILFGT